MCHRQASGGAEPGSQGEDAPGPSTKSSAAQRRVLGLVAAGPCVVLLVVAVRLSPRPSGTGTAQQLGLPGCGTLRNTGWPCPSCGMTTSVVAAVHGDVVASLKAQPFGLVLAIAAVVFGLVSLSQAVTGRNMLGALGLRWWWLGIALAGMLLGWGVKVWIGMADGTLPLR